MRADLASDARALIDRAIARHGGANGARAAKITLAPISLSGILPWAKGLGRAFPLPPRVEIEPHRARAIFLDYPEKGRRGVFDAGRVAIDDAPLMEHRSTFRWPGKLRRWRPIDALYFFGYALTHYHAVPWSLADAEPIAVFETRQSGAKAALTVRFPASVHTHCPVQTFYFDESGLIVRHDYVVDIVGRFARGAHLSCEYVEVDGIPIATHRRVLTRVGRWTVPIVALEARFARPVVVRE